MKLILGALIVVLIVADCIGNLLTKKKVESFFVRLADFEKRFYSNCTIKENDSVFFMDERNIKYMTLDFASVRLDKIESCFQCRMCQDKDQGGQTNNMQPYSKKEIRKLSEYDKKHIECNVLPLKKLVKLFDEGWVVYDTQITTDENIKLLTLAKIT